jgi:hypothetical protein
MKKILALALFTGSLLLSQSPDITGVWRADLQKSKRMGPPIVTYLAIIEQKNAIFNNRTKEEAPLVTETTGIWGQREERVELSFFNNGKPAVRLYQGIPTRLTATVEGNKLVVNGEIAGHPLTFKRTYELSADGKTLTLDEQTSGSEHTMHNTMVLLKQDDPAAAEPLRKAEELAGAHFKNVKTESMKGLPSSEFINRMRYFTWALGKDCEFCHVEHKFDSDDKKEKVTARKMIDMTAAIDEHHFEGKPEVRCFTCHEGHGHPLSRPMFADEIEAEKARAEKEAAEKAAHQPPPPGPAGAQGSPPQR